MGSLIFKKVAIGYDKIPLIKHIDLELNQEKLIALIGENGTGKTTFMKTLLKIIPIIEGDILFDGKSIKNYNQKEWAKVFSAVFSRNFNVPMVRVRELIQISINQSDSVNLKSISELLEITELLDKYANKLSDGQLQKVMIARAILQNTPFVIFDEPTAHLDYKNKPKIFELLKKIVRHTNKTFIVITHEITQAMSMCDEVMYINDNQMYIGTPQEINKLIDVEL